MRVVAPVSRDIASPLVGKRLSARGMRTRLPIHTKICSITQLWGTLLRTRNFLPATARPGDALILELSAVPVRPLSHYAIGGLS